MPIVPYVTTNSVQETDRNLSDQEIIVLLHQQNFWTLSQFLL